MTLSRSEASRAKRKKARSRLIMKANMSLIVVVVVMIGAIVWWTLGSGKGGDGASSGQPPAGQSSGAPNEPPQQGETGQAGDGGTAAGNGEDGTPDGGQEAGGEEAEPGEQAPDSSAESGKDDEPAAAGPSDTLHMTFVGDVMFSDKVADLLLQHGYDYPYKNVKSYFERADISVANLETPVTVGGVPAENKEYVYKSSPDALPELKKAGIDLVNVANNHSMDQGWTGLKDTLRHLDDNGIAHFGGGADADEAFKPAVLEHGGIRVAFLGFTKVVPETSWKAGKTSPGLADTYDYRKPVEAVAAAKKQADVVVVIAHWGEERKDKPVAHQTELAHRYIDAGADLVIASHPHVLQGFEQYKGKWIAYSLGNFIFTTNNVPETWNSSIVEAKCTKSGDCGLQVVPVITKWAQPAVMNEEDGAKLYKHLTDISVNAEVLPDGTVRAK